MTSGACGCQTSRAADAGTDVEQRRRRRQFELVEQVFRGRDEPGVPLVHPNEVLDLQVVDVDPGTTPRAEHSSFQVVAAVVVAPGPLCVHADRVVPCALRASTRRRI